jgi:flagellar biosynthesis protein
VSTRESSPQSTAVALRYDGRGAPRVTAKGRGEVAERILALAREHRVPVREQAELVQLLALVDLGEEVPPQVYRAVAEVIAFAYRIAGKGPPTPEPHPGRRREGS